ncbi:uncharacterized protein [Parasteatoda tepidariorum]|uniref:uncharacterized protein n=1 Tax=Parasteatoda tepidariorum TaxID=114398 RepID=UPI00077F91F1|nr:uncharacterized protein LOC107455864 [Parasteatoda tepidariorum]
MIRIRSLILKPNKFIRCFSSNMMENIVTKIEKSIENGAELSAQHVPAVKNSGNRLFYSLPEDYTTVEQPESLGVEERSLLLKEIYSNISSRTAQFDGPFGWRSVIYCDYAASGQPVKFIEEYISNHVLPFYGNTHTTITATSLQSTYFRHEAKDIIRKSVNASEHDAVILTGNGCTSAVNKLIHALSINIPTVVFVGPYEHNSNVLPWREINAKIVRIKETATGLVDLEHLESELKKHTNQGYQLIGTFTAASNVTGIVVDDKEIAILLHRYGALSFWDYAAAGPYVDINMNPIVFGQNEGLAYKDAIFISPHKFVGGPDTPGILVAKKNLFSNSVPCEPGGGTIFFVTRNGHRYLKDIEMREEGGTPSIIGAIRAGMAFQLKDAVGIDIISKRDKEICNMVLKKWENVPELQILGYTHVQRLPIFSFVIYHEKSGMYLHHNYVCALLNDMFGIQTRSGCACAGAYALDLLGINENLATNFDTLLAENISLDRTHLRRKGEYSEREILRPGFIRLTFPFFMPDSDINFILDAVAMVAKNGWKLLPQYNFNPETAEWKHKKYQVFLSRKWLGSISYKAGHFNVKNETFENMKIPSHSELLADASTVFENAVGEASRKFTPDQQLMFDSESSSLKWFLLPSEAKQYMIGEIMKHIKKPVFVVRNTAKVLQKETLDVNKINNNCDHLNEQDENCNFNSCLRTEERSCISQSELEHNNNSCSLSCFIAKSSNLNQNNILNSRKCKWYSPPTAIFKPFLKAVGIFDMIKDGDKVLVCVSGGKDSLSLLHTLHQYQYYSRKKGVQFEIGAMTVDPKSPLYDPSPLIPYMKALNIPYFYEEQDIISQAASLDKCTSICSFCSRLKRGRIYACAHKNGYNAIALGQHLDDLSESFLMSVFHNGRLRTMKAHYTDKSSSLRIIRPLVFVREKDLRRFAEQKKLPVIPENCPACFEAPKERHRVKQLLATQEVQFPNLYRSLKTAMYPLMAINVTGVEDKLLGKESLLKFENTFSDEVDD